MPAVSYARAADGVHIAYCRLGAGPPLLIAAGPMLSCQAAVLGNPRAYAFLRALSGRYELILVDERGTGSSGGELEERRPVADAADLQAVVVAAGLEAVNVLGAIAKRPVPVASSPPKTQMSSMGRPGFLGPRGSRMTCGTRSPHFEATREVQRSSGSETCVSTSMTWIRSAIAGIVLPRGLVSARRGAADCRVLSGG